MLAEETIHARRRSPGWVRALDRGQIHALALRLRREAVEGGLTHAQDWLWDACISELEYRRRRATRSRDELACSCELCWGPFE